MADQETATISERSEGRAYVAHSDRRFERLQEAAERKASEAEERSGEAVTYTDKKLYVITSIKTGEDGKPFALCQKHFDQWEAKDRVFWRIVGHHTTESCNQCREPGEITACWPDTDPSPSAFKSIDDYQIQLKAKRKRKRR